MIRKGQYQHPDKGGDGRSPAEQFFLLIALKKQPTRVFDNHATLTQQSRTKLQWTLWCLQS
ncbi:protein of unknown function [Xenorhabdus poinarii G6]|uniref:Uncharacterized protein n=1 Tax=Xenorhabdus poinarii G6 TaxID=1354304 RepID=A0A068R8M6_9GAMM|nr:protein of unknown function [Xenorhabdus poinarii G6]